jgi:hypothetical protein
MYNKYADHITDGIHSGNAAYSRVTNIALDQF